MTIGTPSNIAPYGDVRSASKVRLSHSRVAGYDLVEMVPGPVDLGASNEVAVSPVVEARFVRIEVVEASSGAPDSVPLAVNG